MYYGKNVKKLFAVSICFCMMFCLGGCSSEQVSEKTKGYINQVKEAGSDENYSEYKAVYDCFKEIVKDQLDCPSTADFQVFSTSLITSKQEVNGYYVYNVKAYVDADNSFGSTVRSTWDVNIAVGEKDNDLKYKVNSVE